MSKSAIVLAFLSILLSASAVADMIPMQDFIQLKRGMSEAEVLYRVGVSDHESIASDYHHNIIRKTWSYIPERHGSSNWITEIVFDSRGLIQAVKRYKVRK